MNKYQLKESIAHHIRKNETLKKLIKIPYTFFLRKFLRKSFRKYALRALKEFTDCLEVNGYPYVLFAGTMLGAIREHGFIKHDLDIDTAMWIDDFNPKMIMQLEQCGFKLICNYEIDNGNWGKEFTFVYKKTHIKIDIFFFYPPVDKLPYHCDFVHTKHSAIMPRRIEYNMYRLRRKIEFEGINLYIPANAEELCRQRYGKDYMIPNSKWDPVKTKANIVEWNSMIPLTTQNIYHK